MPRILLVNPNTSEATTAAMHAIALDGKPSALEIESATAPFGAPLITEPNQLAVAAEAVRLLVEQQGHGYDGLIIAAYGDPCVDNLRATNARPVVGIAEASIMEAASDGRRFSIVTTTRLLEERIRQRCRQTGYLAQLASFRFTRSDPESFKDRPEQLLGELEEATRHAIAHDGAEAVIIGGGPLAVAARDLRTKFDVPIIEPIPIAVARMARYFGL